MRRLVLTTIVLLAPAPLWAQSPARQPAPQSVPSRPGTEALPPPPELPSAEPPPPPTVSTAPLQDLEPAGMERVTLEEAVKRAVRHNVSVAVSRAEIARADALVREAWALLLPTLTANATYTRLDSDRTRSTGPTTPPMVIARANQESANLQLTLPLLSPGGWTARSQARANRAAVEASAADVTRQVTTAVARAYLAIVSQKRVLEVKARARETARAHYDYAHTRRVGGVGRMIDEVRAAQEVATSEAQIEAARGALTRCREALGVVMGASNPVDAFPDVQLGPTPALDEAMKQLDERADIKAGQARVRAAEQSVRNEWAYYAPYIAAVAQPFIQNPATLTQPQTGWQAQLLFSLPLYDGGMRYGVKRERAALLDAARTNLDGQLRQAQSEVRTAFDVMLRADASLKSAREAAALARRSFELSTLAYQRGATSNLEVIDAERRWRDAETEVAVAEDTARQARLDLLVAAGRFP